MAISAGGSCPKAPALGQSVKVFHIAFNRDCIETVSCHHPLIVVAPNADLGSGPSLCISSPPLERHHIMITVAGDTGGGVIVAVAK